MRVFISYAKEDRDTAALVAQSIKARGHSVFFDRSDLPAGQSYEDQIEAAIGASHLVVFLISPDSVAAGRFTRTELGFAEKKWKSARNRLLPVMLRPTPIDDIPPFVRAVSILEPEGNLPAETAAAAQRLAGSTVRRLRPVAAVGLLLLLAAAGGYAWLNLFAIGLAVETRGLVAFDRPLFDKPGTANVVATITNTGSKSVQLNRVTLETESGKNLGERIGDAGQADFHIPPNANAEIGFMVPAIDPGERWRVCAYPDDASRACSELSEWKIEGAGYGADAFAVPSEIRNGAQAIAWHDGRYLVATRSPDRLWSLDENGTATALRDLSGPPLSILAAPSALFVGLGGAANQIVRLDSQTFAPEATIAIAFPEGVRGAFDVPISRAPVQLASDGQRLWVLTGGDAGGAGLAYLPFDLSSFTVPAWYGEISFDLDGMALRPGAGAIWSATDSVTPASLYRMTPQEIRVAGGHDYEIVSCATDVMESDPIGEVLVPTCDGDLARLATSGGVASLGEFGVLLGYRPSPDNWPVARLGRSATGRVVAAVSVMERAAGPENWETALYAYSDTGGATSLFEAKDARIENLAAGQRTLAALVVDDEGRRQLVVVNLDR